MEIGKFLDPKNFLSYEQVQYHEENGGDDGNSLTSRDVLIFNMEDKENHYVPADSYLHIRGRIVDSAGQPLNDSHKVTLVNSGWSLFSDIRYKMNNVVCEQFNHPAIVHQVHGLTHYSDDYSRGQGKPALWYPDNRADEPYTPYNESFRLRGFSIVDDGQGTPNIAQADITFTLSVDQPVPLVVPSATGAGTTFVLGGRFAAFTGGGNLTGSAYGGGIYLFKEDDGTPLRTENGVAAGGVDIVQLIGAQVGDKIRMMDGYGRELLARSPRKLDNRAYGFIATAGTGQVVLGVDMPQEANADNIMGTTLTPVLNVVRAEPCCISNYEKRRRRTSSVYHNSTSGGFEMTLQLRDILHILQADPMPTTGASLKLELRKTRVDGSLYILAEQGTQAGCYFQYEHASWWVPRVRYNLQTENEYLSLMDGPRSLNWFGYRHEDSGIRTAASSTWDITTINSLPKKCYIFFQESTRLNSQFQNNMIYDNVNLENIYLRIDSEKYPEYPLELRYAQPDEIEEDDYLRAYNMYLSSCDHLQHNTDCLPAISYEQFKEIFPLYCFDLYPRRDNIFRTKQSVQLKLVYKLRPKPQGQTHSYMITAVFLTERELSLDYSSGVISKILAVA